MEKKQLFHLFGDMTKQANRKFYWYQFWPHLKAFRAHTDVSDIAKMARDMKRPKNALKIVENHAS